MTPLDLFREVNGLDPEGRTSVFSCLAEVQDVVNEVKNAQRDGGDLAGMLCLMKDNMDVTGFPTRASSMFLEDVRPAPHEEGGLVKALRSSGAVIVGKTQMNEFAYGLDGANPHTGDCQNPLDPRRCSGGSSSGSAVAVARGWVPLAFGTDTGGSIRVPAAYCGIYGFRLPPDAWALDGIVPLAPSYDSVGWFTSGLNEMSSVSQALLHLPEPSSRPLRIRRILPQNGVLAEAMERIFPESVPDEAPSEWGSADERVGHYNVLQSTEAYEIHKPWIEEFGEMYSPAVRALILRALDWTEPQRVQAAAFQSRLRSGNEELFQHTDVLLVAVSEAAAPVRPMTPEQRAELLAHTVPGSMGGNPVLTLPVKTPEGLSLGIQCVLPPTRWRRCLSDLLQMLSGRPADYPR